jgi:hypothetical protein
MSAARFPSRTTTNALAATAVSMLLATPFVASTTMRPFAIRWDAMAVFVLSHRAALLLGFALVALLSLMLRRATAARATADVDVG